MYGAICDKCGKNCKIPFEPTSGRPVFCSNCFEQNGQTRTTHAELSYKQQFEELNAKMDKILALLTVTPKVAKIKVVANSAESSVEPKAESDAVEEEVKTDATSDVAVEESKAKKPKTKATLAAAKKRAKASPKKK
jgi:CxxC-x17-CxxC domain-containing protein